ncbi:hypothetical protein PR202_ga22791 [Eleusine coracana subsp. coracana]|uniref:DUF4220 domain-containing protein n=1 Tax=Eleusine coracana subsp. coracana TaxID=191504 RepID=A0AAV5D4U9_ELECO|nr:hypothetical protein PR202_ga22791 [Eleusine coracana subsp. coracana]
MIDMERALVWWDEWQLRILVLGSLGMQWFLVLVAPMRKYTVARWFRTCIWLAYISSDAVAIYALATLFNRHARGNSECQYGGKASSLEVLWAPLLLVHLGGREEITAYNIEDNELWTRHTVTLVSQVTVAVYAFCKSWPSDGNGRLLLSAILLFINGIINFCEKPWALRSASINRLVAVSSIIKGERRSPSWWECCFSELDDRYKCWKDWAQIRPKPILSEMDRVQMILSDMSLLAVKQELEKQADGDRNNNNIFLKLDASAKEDQMRRWLRKAFELIYTRANVISAPAYLACNMFLVPALYVAAITLFSVSRKQAYSVTDVKITYILMCFTAVLDVFGVIISMMVYRLMIRAKFPALCETLPEYNLINLVLRRMKPSTGWLLKCCTSVGYKEDYFQVGHDNLYSKVSDFVVTQLMSSQKVDGLDLGSYRSLDKENNNWALDKKLRDYLLVQHPNETKAIQRSLRDLPFDESVLVWHIATDLFFSMKPPYGFHCRPPHDEVLRELCTQAISNYMIYLLNFCPEMLMTGSRKHLFTEATSNLEQLLQDDQTNLPLTADKQRVAKIIIEKFKVDNKYKEDNKYSLIQDACNLANELMALPEHDDRLWELMYRVWVGMLCYSASMCRGYLHAKNLGEGGEFLSYVWLVISLKGAKTLADKLQMSEEANNKPPNEISNKQPPPDGATTSTSEQGTKQSEKDFRLAR